MKKMTKLVLTVGGIIAFMIGYNTVPAFATIIGERVEFSPVNPKPGEEITLIVHFRVEGASFNALSMNYVTDPPAPPSPPPPTIIGRWDAGQHTHRLKYTVPANPPSRICFTINVMTDGRPAPIITGACLETTIRVVSAGTGQRMVSAAPPPQIATDPNGPDLRILEVKPVIRRTGVFIPIVSNIKAAASGDLLITVDTDATIVIKIQNIGRIRAENVRTHVEYNIADQWVPFSEVETIRKLETGRDVTLRIPMVLPKGATGIKIIIDPFNEIREIDEYNNTFTGFFGRK